MGRPARSDGLEAGERRLLEQRHRVVVVPGRVVVLAAALPREPLADAVDNLRRLRAAGCTVLYGTDFGNTSAPGISRAELRLMQAVGMDGRALLDSGTSAAARYRGWSDLGAIASGKSASLLVLTQDTVAHPEILVDPEHVWIGG